MTLRTVFLSMLLMTGLALVSFSALAENEAETKVETSTQPELSFAEKIISQGVPSDALERLFNFITTNDGRQFQQQTYVCIGKDPRSIRPCDDKMRIRDNKTITVKSPLYAAIVDFSIPSTMRRLYLINMKTAKVDKYYVTHGKGTGISKYAYRFSNIKDSKQTSLGFYVAGSVYQGGYGDTLRMYGVDPSNDQAYNRDIVLHGAWYVGEDFINAVDSKTKKKNDRLGVSWGCPAVSLSVAKKIIPLLKDGGIIMHFHRALADKTNTGKEIVAPAYPDLDAI